MGHILPFGEGQVMVRLALHSALTLGLLFGLLFVVLVVVMYFTGAPLWMALAGALGLSFLQFLISPYVIEWIHAIRWTKPEKIDPEIKSLIQSVCRKRHLREPRFGIINDGNPNAFTFGHYPGNARLVITTGLLDVCDARQRCAVVAHELGHIVHWDFVVMTVAGTVPLVLYVLYRFGLRASQRTSKRAKGGLAIAALTAFVAYIIARYTVLFVSRLREYYADEFSARTTRDPNALATGLVKIAYGLAQSRPPEEKEEPVAASAAMKPFGIFDATFGKSMAVSTGGTFGSIDDEPTPAHATNAMKWDLWNPWAALVEISSTHPLPAKRIKALGSIARRMGQAPTYSIPSHPPESYWDEFAVDLLVHFMPVVGFLAGLAVSVPLGFNAGYPLVGGGLIAAGVGLGMLIRLAFVYPVGRFAPDQVSKLVQEVKVSAVRPVPVKMQGQVIGRGIPGLYWGDDLVVQDESGFILLQYRQPVRLLEFAFGFFRADDIIDERVTVEGWYRRAPIPYVEMYKLREPDGDTYTSYNRAANLFVAWLLMGGGLITALLGLLEAM